MSHTTAAAVRLANAAAAESNPENQDGNQQATRKNPHVIDAGFEQGLPVSYWCITLMVISTILPCETYAQFVETVWKKLPGLKLLGGRVILNQTLDLLVQVV